MAMKVLVAYGTKYGATAEIAERIGQTMTQAGLEVDVTPAKRAGSPSEYQAVVLGSAVYMGQWRAEVANFLKDNEKLLSEQPVWIFSSGPSGKGDPVELVQGWRFPKGLAPVIERIKPRDISIFHGNYDVKKMNFIQKWMLNKARAPMGDFRDWAAITRWAGGIAAALKKG